MKLRIALALVVLAAGAVWLALDVRERRGTTALDTTAVARSPDDGSAGVELVPAAASVDSTGAGARLPVDDRSPERGPVHAGLSRGRLVDGRTLEPIPGALVVAGTANARTDANGWFDAREPLDELAELLVLNIGNLNKHVVVREEWLREADHWRVPLAIGPTYRLRFERGVEVARDAWDARLTWEDAEGRAWLTVRAGAPPYLRYDAPVSGPSDGSGYWIEARSRDGLTEARGEVTALVGINDVALACRPRVVVRGRVLDGVGRPLVKVRVSAVHVSDAEVERLRAETDATGTYQLVAAEPGRMQLVLTSAADTRGRQLALELGRGLTQAPDVVFEGREPAGSIRGRLKRRSGKQRVEGTVRVRALDGSGFEQERSSNGSFALDDVPRGRFEVSVVSSYGFRWTPAVLQVDVPAEGLVFTQEDGAGMRRVRFEAFDEDSGEELDSVRVEVQSGADRVIACDLKKGESLDLANGQRFEWRAWARGYRVACGDESMFVARGDVFVARVAMRKGFGTRFVLREWSEIDAFTADPIRPVQPLPKGVSVDPGTFGVSTRRRADPARFAGAEILVEGVPVAAVDDLGVAELDLASQPKRVDVRLPGWRVIDSYSFSRKRPLFWSEAEVFLVRERVGLRARGTPPPPARSRRPCPTGSAPSSGRACISSAGTSQGRAPRRRMAACGRTRRPSSARPLTQRRPGTRSRRRRPGRQRA